jgi:hypothetical protein
VEVSSKATSRPAASSSTTLEEEDEPSETVVVVVKKELAQVGDDGKRDDGKLLLASTFTVLSCAVAELVPRSEDVYSPLLKPNPRLMEESASFDFALSSSSSSTALALLRAISPLPRVPTTLTSDPLGIE